MTDCPTNEMSGNPVARWAGVAPARVAVVSGAAARHKRAGIDRADALPPPAG